MNRTAHEYIIPILDILQVKTVQKEKNIIKNYLFDLIKIKFSSLSLCIYCIHTKEDPYLLVRKRTMLKREDNPLA